MNIINKLKRLAGQAPFQGSPEELHPAVFVLFTEEGRVFEILEATIVMGQFRQVPQPRTNINNLLDKLGVEDVSWSIHD